MVILQKQTACRLTDSNIIGLVVTYLAAKPPDVSHHYGHKKFETMATIGIAILLFVTCFEILGNAVRTILNPKPPQITNMSFIVIFASIAVNIFVTVYEHRKGRLFKSDFLIADSKHTLSDLIASSAVLISIISVKNGYPIIDPIAALFIAVMIGHLGYSIVKEASHVLVDTSPLSGDNLTKIKAIAAAVDGVMECHNVRVRGRSDAVHIDCHILVSPDMNVQEAHNVAHNVEERIKREMPNVVDVVIHLEPH